MSQNLFEVGLGLSLDGLASILPCSGPPGGDTGVLDAAPLGTLALDYTNGKLYQKITAGAGTNKWAVSESATAAMDELGYVQSFIGKTPGNADGHDYPAYTSYGYTGGANVSLEAAIGGLDAGLLQARTVATKVKDDYSAGTIVDSVLVDAFSVVRWVAYASTEAGAVAVTEILATHNGYGTEDATTADYTAYGKLKIGTIAGLKFTVTLSGTGAAQAINLNCEATPDISIKSARYEL